MFQMPPKKDPPPRKLLTEEEYQKLSSVQKAVYDLETCSHMDCPDYDDLSPAELRKYARKKSEAERAKEIMSKMYFNPNRYY